MLRIISDRLSNVMLEWAAVDTMLIGWKKKKRKRSSYVTQADRQTE
jgi:hypothetical protein